MNNKSLLFILTLMSLPLWAGPRMILAAPRVSAPMRSAAIVTGAPLMISNTYRGPLSAVPSMYRPGVNGVASGGLLESLSKMFGSPVTQVPDTAAVSPSSNPVYAVLPSGRPVENRTIQIRPEKRQLDSAPACLGESSGALLLGEIACNAIHVGDGLAMTNCHCTQGMKRTGKIDIEFRMIGKRTVTCPQILNCNTNYDYSMIECPGLKGLVPPAKIAQMKPLPRDQIFISTHDFGNDHIVKRTSTGLMFGEVQEHINGPSSSMLAYAKSIKGNSGSGVFNSKDEVAGLLWGGFVNYRVPNTLFTPIVDIIADVKARSPKTFARIQKAQAAAAAGSQGEKVSACQAPSPERTIAGQTAAAMAAPTKTTTGVQ